MHTHRFEPFWPVAQIREEGLFFYRQAIETYQGDENVEVAGHGRMIQLGSYSYLALNGHPRINQAAQEAISRYGTGAHGARLLAGTLGIHRELEESAAVSGASWWATFRYIIVPLLRPGWIAGWIYIAIVSVRELSSSILLYSPGTEVLSVVLWELWENGQYVELCALGVLMTLALLAIAIVARPAAERIAKAL